MRAPFPPVQILGVAPPRCGRGATNGPQLAAPAVYGVVETVGICQSTLLTSAAMGRFSSQRPPGLQAGWSGSGRRLRSGWTRVEALGCPSLPAPLGRRFRQSTKVELSGVAPLAALGRLLTGDGKSAGENPSEAKTRGEDARLPPAPP